MTPNLITQNLANQNLTNQANFTISHSFFPRCNPALRRPAATPRRTSPVLSVQELRQIVRQMVD